ncbi:MAG: NAD(P)-dependent oxidoreductase, partial [Pseudomonadota bacterium]
MKTPPLPPGSTIGIMGTGQLGRMLAAAAAKLGFKVIIYGPDKTPPAAQLANEHICASYEARDALELFAQKVDVATYEFENIPVSTVGLLIKEGASVRPGHEVLEVCQDRLFEKQFLQKLGLMTAPYWDVKSPHDLEIAL